jgi:hypothetical protein
MFVNDDISRAEDAHLIADADGVVAEAWTAAAHAAAHARSTTVPLTTGVSVSEGDCHNRRDCDDRRHNA